MRRAIEAVLAVSAFWLSGCGTVQNLQLAKEEGGRAVYGGVKRSLHNAQEIDNWNFTMRYLKKDTPIDSLAVAYWRVVDTPLSAVGDTLTLPFTLLSSRELQEETVWRRGGLPPPGEVTEGEMTFDRIHGGIE
jgi:uncharacterized protein YceK